MLNLKMLRTWQDFSSADKYFLRNKKYICFGKVHQRTVLVNENFSFSFTCVWVGAPLVDNQVWGPSLNLDVILTLKAKKANYDVSLAHLCKSSILQVLLE